jgi:2-polyprenyl-3-methyl-5-hydroxy-6-metoxy-1,4-benzoquinol methylase
MIALDILVIMSLFTFTRYYMEDFMIKTKDPVNQGLIKLEEKIGLEKLGIMNSAVWHEDPKRLVFTLSRYKFVSKMLSGKNNVVEIGCGDGFGSRIVKQAVNNLTITDYDPYFIRKFKEIESDQWQISASEHDILCASLDEKFDALYSLDVFEHISANSQDIFIKNIINSINDNGIVILGMPSIESQVYASPQSKDGHINCKSGKELKLLMDKYFDNVFLFSMNDEVVHTGYEKMAHYLFVLCCGVKK